MWIPANFRTPIRFGIALNIALTTLNDRLTSTCYSVSRCVMRLLIAGA
jgi:hypothetical protein